MDDSLQDTSSQDVNINIEGDSPILCRDTTNQPATQPSSQPVASSQSISGLYSKTLQEAVADMINTNTGKKRKTISPIK